jgi:hypothetical protein
MWCGELSRRWCTIAVAVGNVLSVWEKTGLIRTRDVLQAGGGLAALQSLWHSEIKIPAVGLGD